MVSEGGLTLRSPPKGAASCFRTIRWASKPQPTLPLRLSFRRFEQFLEVALLIAIVELLRLGEGGFGEFHGFVGLTRREKCFGGRAAVFPLLRRAVDEPGEGLVGLLMIPRLRENLRAAEFV